MEFEILGLDLGLSDKYERYYMVDMVAHEEIDNIEHLIPISVVYDSQQKLIYDYLKILPEDREMSSHTGINYVSKNGYTVKLLNISNNFRHTSDFKKHYEMHKVNVDVALEILIGKKR